MMSQAMKRANRSLPYWLQTKEQLRQFLETLEPYKEELMRNPYHAMYYDVSVSDMEDYLFDVLVPYLIKYGFELRSVRVKEENLEKYMNEGRYLPDFMQDFHDQKNFFKRVSHLPYGDNISWLKAQCYTVDLFLWNIMRLHGCKFQRTLRKPPIMTIEEELLLLEQPRS